MIKKFTEIFIINIIIITLTIIYGAICILFGIPFLILCLLIRMFSKVSYLYLNIVIDKVIEFFIKMADPIYRLMFIRYLKYPEDLKSFKSYIDVWLCDQRYIDHKNNELLRERIEFFRIND